jgi:hypothetical protein
MVKSGKIVEVRFFRSDSGRSYVKEWLLKLAPGDRKVIGEGLKTVE